MKINEELYWSFLRFIAAISILVLIIFVLICLAIWGGYKNWGSPNRAFVQTDSIKSREILYSIFEQDFGLEVDGADKVTHAVIDHEDEKILLMIEPNDRFDYQNFIWLLLNNKFRLKGYDIQTLESEQPKRDATYSGKSMRRRNHKLDWWCPDDLNDVRKFTIRVGRKDLDSKSRRLETKMYCYISEQENKIYIGRFTFPTDLSEQFE